MRSILYAGLAVAVVTTVSVAAVPTETVVARVGIVAAPDLEEIAVSSPVSELVSEAVAEKKVAALVSQEAPLRSFAPAADGFSPVADDDSTADIVPETVALAPADEPSFDLPVSESAIPLPSARPETQRISRKPQKVRRVAARVDDNPEARPVRRVKKTQRKRLRDTQAQRVAGVRRASRAVRRKIKTNYWLIGSYR